MSEPTFLESVVRLLRAGALAPAGPEEWVAPRERLEEVLPPDAAVLLVTPPFDESRHVVGLVVRRRRLLAVLKTPRGAWDRDGVLHEGSVLRTLLGLVPGAAGTAPEALACVTAGDRRVLVETPVLGRPLNHAEVRKRPDSVGIALDWVRALPVTGASDGAAAVAELLEPGLTSLERILPGGNPLLEVVDRTRLAMAPLAGRQLPRVLEHGDASYPNLFLVDKAARLGVVDWELGESSGMPGHDLVQLLAFLSFARAGVHGTADEVPVLQRDLLHPDGWAHRILRTELEPAVGQDLVVPLLVAAWARAAVRLLARVRTSEDDHGRARLLALMESSRNVALWRETVAALG